MTDEQTLDRIVVAIPTATEPIHHMGDAAEPKHMTLVRLGAPEENPDLDMAAVQEEVRAIAEASSGPVTAPVESQGPLGEDGAQVVFLGQEGVAPLHDELLAAPTLREGIGAVQQHPDFTPHVTLAYEGEGDAVAEGDLPDEVIFDRLGVWDGDEHIEFPLGPSASTEETAETEPEPEATDEMIDELLVAMTRPIGDPLVVIDAATLASACTQADALDDEATQLTTRRVLMRRARSLGCQHVIPRTWLRRTLSVANGASTARPTVDVLTLFQTKTEMSGLSDTALRAAYMRGVREYTMTAPASRPPLPRDVVAQARVNSLIRLAQGDLSARTDDRDLLS